MDTITPNMIKATAITKCDDCPNEAKYRIVNGDDTCVICRLCASEIIFEMVTENEYTGFHSHTRADETVLTIE